MEIKGIKWMGVCTQNWDQTLHFFTDMLGLQLCNQGNLSVVEDRRVRYAELAMPDGDFVEVFDQNLPESDLFSSPVLGFLVDDVASARSELEAKGVSFIGPIYSGTDWVWSYFRSPDSQVFQLMSPLRH
jgi:predicted enzyme related to lactoylglutathione lyase